MIEEEILSIKRGEVRGLTLCTSSSSVTQYQFLYHELLFHARIINDNVNKIDIYLNLLLPLFIRISLFFGRNKFQTRHLKALGAASNKIAI